MCIRWNAIAQNWLALAVSRNSSQQWVLSELMGLYISLGFTHLPVNRENKLIDRIDSKKIIYFGGNGG